MARRCPAPNGRKSNCCAGVGPAATIFPSHGFRRFCTAARRRNSGARTGAFASYVARDTPLVIPGERLRDPGPSRQGWLWLQRAPPTAVMPAKAGTQTSLNKTSEAGRSVGTAHASALHVAWIPACAGMTRIVTEMGFLLSSRASACSPPPPSCRRRPAPRQASTKRQTRVAPWGQHMRVRFTLPGSQPAPG